MHDLAALPASALRAGTRRLGALALAATLSGCAPPLVLDSARIENSAATTAAAAAADSAADLATVQLRFFSFSPDVAIVAWMGSEGGYGLRGVVRRDGTLVRDHSLYVTTYYDPAVRAFPLAAVPSMPLLVGGARRDTYSCYFGNCSPHEVFTARLPDELLRTASDSVPVRFYGQEQRQLVITLRRDLITAYLGAVDSVSQALRRRTDD